MNSKYYKLSHRMTNSIKKMDMVISHTWRPLGKVNSSNDVKNVKGEQGRAEQHIDKFCNSYWRIFDSFLRNDEKSQGCQKGLAEYSQEGVCAAEAKVGFNVGKIVVE